MKKIGYGAGAIIGLILAWATLWPTPLDPLPWVPTPDEGFVGQYSVNDALAGAEILPLDFGHGPEDVAVDAAGNIYGGLDGGRIIKITPDGSQTVFATIEGGRPLGLHFDAAGNLIVADSWKGLLSIDTSGSMTVLSTASDGVPFAFADDLDIASDGKIYFSDASYKYNQPDFVLDLLEARGNGRLLVYDPATQQTTTLLDGLYFANGVALSKNEDFVLVNETGRYRITRYWLKGEKAGTRDTFVDNLPGFPDGVSSNRNGVFWVAIPTPRNPVIDDNHSSPFMKKFLSRLPAWAQPAAIKYGLVVAFDENGTPLGSWHDADGDPTYMVTSVEQVGNQIYIGSLEAPQIVRMGVPEI